MRYPEVSRRDLLRGAGTGIALLGLAGCGAVGASSKNDSATELWYWNRSIPDDLLADAHKHIPHLDLRAEKIGGDFKAKLRTTLAGRSHVPDITGLNSDIASYFPDEDVFIDLHDLGAGKLKSEYLDWKWKLGIAPDGRMVGFPIDTGPTALMYRKDLFAKAGLPTEPDEVAAAAHTWDHYIEMGVKLQRKLPGVKFAPNLGMFFTQAIAQLGTRYFTPSGKFIGDQKHIRDVWDMAIRAHKAGIAANTSDYAVDWSAGYTNGQIATLIGAIWAGFILEDSAASTSGKWRVCPAPGGAGNSGGSFLAITKYANDPQKSFDLITWLQSPKNQTKAYDEIALFPSTPGSFDDPAMRKPAKFFGNQKIIDVFGPAAKAIKPVYLSPYDSDLVDPVWSEEILNVQNAGKNPDQAWDDAVSKIKRQLKHAGGLS